MRGPIRRLDDYAAPRVPRNDREKQVWRASALVTTIFVGGIGLLVVVLLVALWWMS